MATAVGGHLEGSSVENAIIRAVKAKAAKRTARVMGVGMGGEGPQRRVRHMVREGSSGA